MTNLDSVLTRRSISLPTKVHETNTGIFIGRTEAEAPILWPPDVKSWLLRRPWCWEGLRAGREGDDRGWDAWMASQTQWTRVLVDSGSWWWIGRPGMQPFMGSKRVGHDWATSLSFSFTFTFYVSIHFKVKYLLYAKYHFRIWVIYKNQSICITEKILRDFSNK